ncbi:hypothetical protein [Cytobacillus firmus]|uniref:hypothetical protein n=1 Tax=Cytobacillus firmus TaxID=1399 RepID=UPI0018CE89AB|nr:hypothetical protein [Cytobacillus firmus]MBG9587228.1 hypothetical protein [Cytobacillus firmus]
MNENRLETNEILRNLLNDGDMVGPLTMPDGKTSASITVETSFPGQTNKKEEFWPFIVPTGYVRFSGQFVKEHNAGDSAHCDWANNNPADGTVYAKVKCSQANGYAHASASNVYAIKPEAAEKLYKKGLNEIEK